MTRRVPPKRRHRERVRPATPRLREQQTQQLDGPSTEAYSAPSHLGGTFEDHGYGSGHGAFGFTQHVTP